MTLPNPDSFPPDLEHKPTQPSGVGEPDSLSSTLSFGKSEIDDRDPSLRVKPDVGEPFTVLLIQRMLNIGSDSSQEVPLKTPGIAPRHARLMVNGASYTIFDVTNNKGILINGQPVDSAVLKDGDLIRLQDANGQGASLSYFNPVERALGTSSVGKVYHFEHFPFIIGRDPKADIRIEALAVSWKHAQVIQDDSKHHILSDLGSTNGTFVNDRKIAQPHRLQPDDVIRIDKVLLVYKGLGLQRLASAQKIQIDAVSVEMTYQAGFPAKPLNVMRDVSLAIKPEEFVAIIGGSGSGKSTLLRALNGANRATGGKVLVNGEDLYQHYEQYQPIIGYVPQKDIVQDGLTVYQSLLFAARLRFPNEPEASRLQRIERALESLELQDFTDRLVGNLSGGQKKRVSIALELMADPRLLFLDEPSSGLDPGLDQALMYELQKLAKRGHTVLVVTHTTLNIRLCDQVVLMARGNLAYYGPPQSILDFFKVNDFPEIYNKVQEAPPISADSGSPSALTSAGSDTPKRVSASEAGKGWAERFRRSSDYVANITRRMTSSDSKPPAANILNNKRLMGARRGSFFQQAKVLTARTLALVRRDYRTLLAMLLVLPLVGLFLGLISLDDIQGGRGQMLTPRFEKSNEFTIFFERYPLAALDSAASQAAQTPGPNSPQDSGGTAGQSAAPSGLQNRNVRALGTYSPASDAQRLLFMAALSVTLLGIFASAYTIVEERSLFMRERMVNLRIPPYVISKAVVYGGLSILSCILFMLTLSVGVKMPSQGVILPGIVELFLTLALTAFAGVSIGILLSALAKQVNAVTYAVLAVLFVQILFPGVLFKMDGALEPLSRLTVTRWSLEALGGTVDMVQRNAEGRIVVETPLINPKNNKPIAGQFTRQLFPAPNALSVTYPTEVGDQLLRWGVLLGFSLVFLTAAGIVLNRSESF